MISNTVNPRVYGYVIKTIWLIYVIIIIYISCISLTAILSLILMGRQMGRDIDGILMCMDKYKLFVLKKSCWAPAELISTNTQHIKQSLVAVPCRNSYKTIYIRIECLNLIIKEKNFPDKSSRQLLFDSRDWTLIVVSR